LIDHAGVGAVRLLADNVGLTAALSKAVKRRGASPDFDRGEVLRDVAVAIADGSTTVAGTRGGALPGGAVRPRSPRPRPRGGRWRRPGPARAEEGRQGPGGGAARRVGPDRRAARRDPGRADLLRGPGRDHRDPVGRDRGGGPRRTRRRPGRGAFKGTWGHHPLLGWCGNTGEMLAIGPRAGNAASNDAADHLVVIDECVAQIPPAWRRDLMPAIDGAGASIAVAEHPGVAEHREDRRAARQEGGVAGRVRHGRAHAGRHRPGPRQGLGPRARPGRRGSRGRRGRAASPRCCARAPAGTCSRTGRPGCAWSCAASPRGLEQTLEQAAQGWRYQAIATNTGRGEPPADRRRPPRPAPGWRTPIRCAKDTGLANLPCHWWNANQTWLLAVQLATTLLAWTALLVGDADLANAEPATGRQRLLHAAARLIHTGRQRILRFSENGKLSWPHLGIVFWPHP
jgi:hypothetical protein